MLQRWKRALIVLGKKSLPGWLTFAEISRLTDEYNRVIDGEYVDYKNIALQEAGFSGGFKDIVDSFVRRGYLETRVRENGYAGPDPLEYRLTELGKKKLHRMIFHTFKHGVLSERVLLS